MPEITVGNYLFNRVKQLGVDSVFGVPGDFNLALLDHIYEVDGLRWVGNTNELNAGYAADGYSRVKGLGVLVTTFGVGELSALNAVAGAFAEHVGLVHIAGIPATSSQNKKLLLHHTLGNGDYTVYKKMSEYISDKSYILDDLSTVAAKIDDAFRTAFLHQRPVYIAIPTQMGELKLDSKLLDTPIDLSLPPNNEEAQDEVIASIIELISKAKSPIILVDACASRHDVRKETAQLAAATNFPVFSTPMGKSVFDESNPRFGGCYVGSLSAPEVSAVVEHADLIISIGALLSDFNTGSFTYSYNTRNIVEFHSDHIKIKRANYENVSMKPVLQNLIPKLSKRETESAAPVPRVKSKVDLHPGTNSKLSQDYLWTRLSGFLQPGDVIVTETGTSSFGILNTVFPKQTIGISQVLWGSIGYSVGAALGAALGLEEIDPKRRVLLFVGDGSLQLTVQAISTMVRWNLKPYLFILNNDGYTIERLIHGETAGYNDINPWKYTKLLELFNAKNSESLTIGSVGELDTLFVNKEFATPDKIRVIELLLPKMDAPISLVKQAQITSKTNSV